GPAHHHPPHCLLRQESADASTTPDAAGAALLWPSRHRAAPHAPEIPATSPSAHLRRPTFGPPSRLAYRYPLPPSQTHGSTACASCSPLRSFSPALHPSLPCLP